MKLIVYIVFSLLPICVVSLENLQSQTDYGNIKFYSKPDPNFISGEFSPRNERSIRIIFSSLITDEKQEIKLTDGNKNVLIHYITTSQGTASIQIGQLNFIGQMSADILLHDPTSEFPINSNYQTHLDIFSTIEKLDKSNITIQHALELAISMPEYELVEGLSRSLAEVLGSSGRDHPSIMAVYFASQNLIQSRSTIISDINRRNRILPRTERKSHECKIEGQNQILSDLSTCTQEPVGAICHGLCGPVAVCWNFVCGDCCYHQGCADHDTCCSVKSYQSIQCLFPQGFTCEKYTCSK
ncbi:hypothetical protein LOD99_3512 [Oopsacas minuta]|uniref:Uncharacterized protein n=1 Tax=Oopsacas minuta TaxID=111878 RepID=A0AAV7JXL2_9METZ|nr:hypothetical protein LOD99_3512 [Oopsacas minuta]